ncbi:MAG: hypothetical protein EU532_04740 [Promethearchaeota archaeon]|nr:MAG: hypothetical protein EU532_04740 [Candidatus Lokiarchaeota archaeon]
MVKSQKISVKSSNKRLKCAICHNDINDISLVHQPQLNLGVICTDCCEYFSKEDIRSMLELFLMYGGYFGQLRNQNFSLITELKKINLFYSHDKSLSSDEIILEVNSRLLHNALVHGIHPKDYLHSLKKLLNDSLHDYFL